MTDKLELKSSHEVIDTVNVADVEYIFYCKPTDQDILTVLIKDGKRLYCDEVCPVQEVPKPLFNVGDIIRSKVWESATHKIVSMDDKAYYLENEGKVEITHQKLWELAEEPVSIWHDASEETPTQGSNILMVRKKEKDTNYPPNSRMFSWHKFTIRWQKLGLL